MTISFSAALRTARLNAIVTAAGAGAKLRIYDGTKPAAGAALSGNTLLAEFTLGATLGTALGATLTFGAVSNVNGSATGTPTWFRIVLSDGTTFLMDGTAGGAGSDLVLSPAAITSGQPVSISSMTISEANA